MSNKAEYRRMAKALTTDEISALVIADSMRRADAAEIARLSDTIASLVEREMIIVNRRAVNGFVITNLGEWVMGAR